MTDDTVTVTPKLAADVVKELQRKLGEGWRVMPIGGTRMGEIVGGTFTTKDIDIVLVVIDGKRLRVPSLKQLEDVGKSMGEIVAIRENSTSVKIRVQTSAGPVLLELIRGMSPGKGGYFPTTKIFGACASVAKERGGRLELPREALAFLKAWAANDKEKRVAAGKDAKGYHAIRLEAFKRDVRVLLTEILDAGGTPDAKLVAELIAACPKQRAKDIRRIMSAEGWIIP